MEYCHKCGTPLRRGKYSLYCKNCNHSHCSPRSNEPHGAMHNHPRMRHRKGKAWMSRGKIKNRKR